MNCSNPGLTTAEVEERKKKYGPNELPEKRPDGPLSIFYRQFHSPFIYVLMAAALVSLGLGQYVNSVFIFIVLFINALIGTIQEYSAQRSALALRKMVPQNASVVRDGVSQVIAATEIVPGDYVQLVSGDKVPADIKLENCHQLFVNQSMLTGESAEVAKHTDKESLADTPPSERKDAVYAGTLIARGRAQGTVFATGSATAIGRIAKEVSEPETNKPPLLQRIERFTLRISYGVLFIIGLIFLLTLARGEDLSEVFLLGVALAVSAIPEGLPAAITVALAIGMRRMAKSNVIVRNLIAVESLGSCTYIASDKTGTLTVNEMTLQKVVLPDGQTFMVSGEGMDPSGTIVCAEQAHENDKNALESLIRAGMLANEASLTCSEGTWEGTGDGVDIAFLILALKNKQDVVALKEKYPELSAVPYESENAFSACLSLVQGEHVLHVKGSAEKILEMCTGTQGDNPIDTGRIVEQAGCLAKEGYRVLALAERHLPLSVSTIDDHLCQLNFLGLVGMIDPLRPEAKDAVYKCHEARIKVGMVTGDHPQTALALSNILGIADQGSQPVTGKDLVKAEALGSENLARLINETSVFARVEPNQKLTIVDNLIKQGHFVAVTGDGVNDAPALHHAHVGIAMGKRGSDVARESADLIITDDNFASIVEGIKQGRIVYSNIRKVVFLLISTGAAEIMLFILSVVFALPIPLFPIQLLWLNLVTNGIQDVALAFEPEEGDELKRPPRKPDERIFNPLMIERVITNALVMGTTAFMLFAWLLNQGMAVESARNLTLLLMVLFENVHVLNSRSETLSIFRQRFFGNPFLLFGMLAAQSIHILAMYTPGLSSVLQVEPVSLEQWLSLLVLALILIVVDESQKWWHNRSHRNLSTD